VSTDLLCAAQFVAAKHVLRELNSEIGPEVHHGGEVANNTTNGLVAVTVVDANLKRKEVTVAE
jgi:hypothetical protein